jgi:predicted Zn-dependent protease
MKLEALLAQAPTDPFLRYSLALEILKTDPADGLARLRSLAAESPDYHPACFQLGQTLARTGEVDEACRWLDQGIAAATRQGDAKAAREMQELRLSLA